MSHFGNSIIDLEVYDSANILKHSVKLFGVGDVDFKF